MVHRQNSRECRSTTPAIRLHHTTGGETLTTTEEGLQVCSEIDANLYPKKGPGDCTEMLTINLSRAQFRGECNYTISSNQQPP
jgi:hypothetical protein